MNLKIKTLLFSPILFLTITLILMLTNIQPEIPRWSVVFFSLIIETISFLVSQPLLHTSNKEKECINKLSKLQLIKKRMGEDTYLDEFIDEIGESPLLELLIEKKIIEISDEEKSLRRIVKLTWRRHLT